MNEDDFFDNLMNKFKETKEYAKETGQDAEELLFSLGSDEKPQSFKEFNESGQVMPFVCLNTSIPAMIPDCTKQICDGCQIEVWMSPATKIAFDKVDKKIILCMDCMSKNFEKEEQSNPQTV